MKKRIIRRRSRRVSAPGCDDAPVVEIQPALLPKPITLIYPYYENPRFLQWQLAHWLALPPAVRAHIRAIIVDDGSPEHPAIEVLADVAQPFPMRLFRISDDVRWNWLTARNIGLHHAGEGWCAVTDMDHVLPAETLVGMIWGAHDPETIYRFQRMEHTGDLIHPHPNSWFLTREMYWRVGGHDEALSGFYGTDGEYRRRAAATAPIRIQNLALIRHEYIADSSTTRYMRKQPEDRAVQALIAGRGPDWTPKTLSFPYDEVAL